MAIYRLGESEPQFDASVYVAPNASVIGNVTLAARCTVWFGATIRGDNEVISIGANSNIQDAAVLHTDPGFPMHLGTSVSVGHQAMLHGCTIGDESLIGIQAIILNGAVIGSGSLVGAGAIVTERKVFGDGVLILGAPARVVRELKPEERDHLRVIAENYALRGAYYREQLLKTSA